MKALKMLPVLLNHDLFVQHRNKFVKNLSSEPNAPPQSLGNAKNTVDIN